eukprot:GHVU01203967.1.p2 GENE.GHVU01203967.1~~GHVU01203967.1.p2  ORF type:complete len:108 (-),score=8.50 GHVU01203967.1:467-790(-)
MAGTTSEDDMPDLEASGGGNPEDVTFTVGSSTDLTLMALSPRAPQSTPEDPGSGGAAQTRLQATLQALPGRRRGMREEQGVRTSKYGRYGPYPYPCHTHTLGSQSGI